MIINGKVFSLSELSCAYHQVPLSLETQKLTSFIIGGKQHIYPRGFYGLCGLPNFFSRLMTIHFDPLIKKKQAITYIDDIILQSQNKNEMFTVINEYHTLLRKAGLKAAPDKTFFFLKKVKFHGHVISPEGIQPIAKRVKDLKNLKSPASKRDIMKVLGCLGFYSCYIKNLHVESQPFYDLIKDSPPSTGHTNTKNCSNRSRTESAKTRSLLYPPLIIPFTFTWIHRMLERAVS